MSVDSLALTPIYERLVAAGIDFVVVGGQAVNLWAEAFADSLADQGAEWRPFASKDLDCLGTRSAAVAAAAACGAKAEITDPFGKAFGPVAGQFTCATPAGNVEVQFLNRLIGVEVDRVRNSRREVVWNGVTLPVEHPVLALRGKLAALWALDQGDRQDLKHVNLLNALMPAFIRGQLVGDPEGAIATCRGLVQLAVEEDSLKTWYRHGVQIEQSIPLSDLTAHADVKIRGFAGNFARQVTTLEERRREFESFAAGGEAGRKMRAKPKV